MRSTKFPELDIKVNPRQRHMNYADLELENWRTLGHGAIHTF
jgi:hypothetical protein